ncbi:tannase and feruloyl esterase [Xylogone sp. PMI_703]|nr:tannase and feruloyl esterase [Xylogone sp. PMI_703]
MIWISLTILSTIVSAALSADSPFTKFLDPTTTADCPTFAHNYLRINTTSYTAGDRHIGKAVNKYAFCEVNAIVHYEGGNALHFSLWLPEESQYGGSFTAVGNGGMAGTIDYSNMMTQLNAGFAVAGGDAGHQAANNNNGNGAPNTFIPYLHDTNQVKAWIHNAISLFTPVAKELTREYYGKSPQYSYYNGCSTGGAQGFALAQLHPELFDGIIAGSPAPWYSHLMIATLWSTFVTNSSASYLPQSVLNFTTSKVLDACDALDGVTDRLIEDPLKCEFDIDSLLYNDTYVVNSTSVKAIYAGPPVSSVTGYVYPGLSFGSEIMWLGQEAQLSNIFAIPTLQNLAFHDSNYDLSKFDWNASVGIVDQNAGQYIDEISVNLKKFKQRGGKMMVTQGWSDPNLSALLPIQYLEALQNFFGGDVSDFFNVFMIPGGGHCGAASYYPSVPASYHTVPKLVDWVERGVKPTEILTTNPPDGSSRSRKICAWPLRAVYVQGDVNDWNSYSCEASS